MGRQNSLPWVLAKDSSECCWPAVAFWLVLGPLAFLISPLELDTSLANPDGVFDAQRGKKYSSLSFKAGLLDLLGPVVLLTGFEIGFGEPFSCASLAGDLEVSGWLKLWDAATSLEVAFQAPSSGGSNKSAASLDG